MDKDIRRVDVVDHNGYMIKTYYEKYSQNYNGWLKANCKKNKSNILSCDFTSNSLILINNSKSDNNNKKSINNNSQQNEQNLEQQQQELEQQQQELEQQQQELEQQEQENLNEQEFLRCEENC